MQKSVTDESKQFVFMPFVLVTNVRYRYCLHRLEQDEHAVLRMPCLEST